MSFEVSEDILDEERTSKRQLQRLSAAVVPRDVTRGCRGEQTVEHPVRRIIDSFHVSYAPVVVEYLDGQCVAGSAADLFEHKASPSGGGVLLGMRWFEVVEQIEFPYGAWNKRRGCRILEGARLSRCRLIGLG